MDLGHAALTILLLAAVLELVLERRAGARAVDERDAARQSAAEFKAAAETFRARWDRALDREMQLLQWKARHYSLVKRYAAPTDDAPTQKATVN